MVKGVAVVTRQFLKGYPVHAIRNDKLCKSTLYHPYHVWQPVPDCATANHFLCWLKNCCCIAATIIARLAGWWDNGGVFPSRNNSQTLQAVPFIVQRGRSSRVWCTMWEDFAIFFFLSSVSLLLYVSKYWSSFAMGRGRMVGGGWVIELANGQTGKEGFPPPPPTHVAKKEPSYCMVYHY